MPHQITIPAHTKIVCTGCKFLSIQPGMRGRFYNTNHYECVHPSQFKPGIRGGSSIEFNSKQMPETPNWCPIKDEVTKEPLY